VVMCGGHHQEAPPYMTEMFERHREQCSEGWCFSRKIDCQSLQVLLATWFGLICYSFIWLVRTRRRATSGLRNRLHLGRSLSGSSCEDDRFGSEAAWGFSDTVGSSDSPDSGGSWTHRLWRCMGRCSDSFCCRRAPISTLIYKAACRLCCAWCVLCCCVAKCFRRISPEESAAAGSSQGCSPCYSQALDNSPTTDRVDCSSQSVAGTGLRDRPRPLDIGAGCGLPDLYSSNTAASTPSISQQKVRARACPSSSPSACSASPIASEKGSPLGRMLSASPSQTPLGRNYSHLSD